VSQTESLESMHRAEKFLAGIGLSLADLSQMVPDLQPGEALLFVGSIPDGLAAPGTDVDLMRLGQSKGQGMLRPFGCGIESVWRVRGGTTINIDAWKLEDVEALFRRFLDGFRAIDGAELEPSVHSYSHPECLLLHRCATGLILQGSQLVSELRSRYRLAELSSQFLMYNYLAYHSRLGNAKRQVQQGDNLSALWMLAEAMDHLAITMLASVGETNPQLRWRVRLLQRWSSALGEERVEQLLTFLLPDRTADAAQLVRDAEGFARTEVGRIISRMPKNIVTWPSVPELEWPTASTPNRVATGQHEDIDTCASRNDTNPSAAALLRSPGGNERTM
jgi:hypothetical protein